MNLRQAAEQALEALMEKGEHHQKVYRAAEALRQALNETPPCKTHPDAPHGFDRNASHSADRYVCECEGWEPPKKEWVGLTDGEIHKVVSKKWWDWEDAFDIEGFSRAIEAKLKEKNT